MVFNCKVTWLLLENDNLYGLLKWIIFHTPIISFELKMHISARPDGIICLFNVRIMMQGK